MTRSAEWNVKSYIVSLWRRVQWNCYFVSLILRVSSLATVVSLSPSYFSAMFGVSLSKQHVGIWVSLPRSSMFARFQKCSAPDPNLENSAKSSLSEDTSLLKFSCSSRRRSVWLDRTGPPKHHRTEELASTQRPLAAEERNSVEKEPGTFHFT